MFDIIHTIGVVACIVRIGSNNRFKKLGPNSNLLIYTIRVCEKPRVFSGELAGNVRIGRTTAFRTVKKLAMLGYFELEKGTANQKIKRVYPTEKTTDIYPQLHEYEQKRSDFLLSNLSTEEIAQLKQLMTELKC